MSHHIQSTCLALVAGLCVPVAAEDAADVAPQPADEDVVDVADVADVEEVQPGTPPMTDEQRVEMERVGSEFLQASNDMWLLLSSVRSKNDADDAADRMMALVAKIYELDEKLSTSTVVAPDAACAGVLDNIQGRILDSLETVDEEFHSLSRLHCYGSERLLRAFRLAGRAGLFGEEDARSLAGIPQPFTPEQAAAEIARLGKLLEPDRQICLQLGTVRDSASAQQAVPHLRELEYNLLQLAPPQECGMFADERAESVRTAIEPLRQALWGIRNEIVRLAALPGYSEAAFDEFSEQLDKVYDALEATHSLWFEDVFDASFRSDLEDAYRENIKNTKP